VGRRFLRHNNFLVDVSKNATYLEQEKVQQEQ